MSGVIFPHDQAMPIDAVPLAAGSKFVQRVMDALDESWRMLAFFGLPHQKAHGKTGLVAILAQAGELWAMRSEPLESFESMAPQFPQTQLFEREIHEQWGIAPLHHPWLKPVRITPDSRNRGHDADYGFYRVQGAQAHEVGVGPVHAGIIEPGHFRFQCYGEQVLNLEIALGYQHRGVEEMLLRPPATDAHNQLRLRVVECIAGDASVAHATAQCVMLERMHGIGNLPPRERYLRRIGLELERLACHCGDLGAMGGDTGFLPTAAWNGRIRGDFLNLTAAICGNRFGREFVCPGGVNWDLDPEECASLLERLKAAGRDAIGSCQIMFDSASVMDRFHGTGTVSREDAASLGLVGVAARACGLERDARFDTPVADLPLYDTRPRIAATGDVYARASVRMQELEDSLSLVGNDLLWLADHRFREAVKMPAELPANMLSVAQVESWRGEVCHVAITGSDSQLLACKIVDPSFHNWAGLALGMRDGQISDFPLCNKSYNLSYCGHDL